MPSDTNESPDETPAAPAPGEPHPADAVGPVGDAMAPGEAPIPAESELESTATPATVRRAPKFSAFITFGALGGMLLGLLLAVILHPGPSAIADGSGFISFLDGEGAIRVIAVVAVGVVGAFVGGALAVRADRRSRPPRIGR